MQTHRKIRSLPETLDWLDGMQRTGSTRATGAWPLATVLDHLAQSVEMSLDGYPQPRSALFQRTAGRAAFAWFRRQGVMHHGLSAPIPGAPPLRSDDDWRAASRRLRLAIERFTAHEGPLLPHFAYGPLSKVDYAQAHVLHIANHQDEIAG